MYKAGPGGHRNSSGSCVVFPMLDITDQRSFPAAAIKLVAIDILDESKSAATPFRSTLHPIMKVGLSALYSFMLVLFMSLRSWRHEGSVVLGRVHNNSRRVCRPKADGALMRV